MRCLVHIAFFVFCASCRMPDDSNNPRAQDADALGAARAHDDSTARETGKPTVQGHLRFVRAPSGNGDLTALVRGELERAGAEKRDLLVYEGGVTCEPCQYFHRAAERGELDAQFPTLTLLEFDADEDGERLASAGYVSHYIPLFAVPGKDGRSTGKQLAGAIKGDGAVAYIVPRLRALLAQAKP
jgi:hypothetical protein